MELPGSLIEQLTGVPGFDAASFIDAHNRQPETSVRINPIKGAGYFPGNERVPWCANGRYLPERPVFTLDPAYHAGAYYVQEASSMFLEHVVKEVAGGKNGIRVLDLCAAPGGKSTLLASVLDSSSLLVSNEVIRSRASVLEENMTRWGYSNTWVTCNDPREFSKLTGYFDLMVIDAPCSGSGLWRKDHRALDEWSAANVQLCCGRQQRIIADAWPALKEGGVLVYSTCSYSPQEDEDIMDWIAETYDASTVDVRIPGSWGIVETTSKRGMKGFRFFPGKVRGEGLYIAVVRKNESAAAAGIERFRPVDNRKVPAVALNYLGPGDWAVMENREKVFFGINREHESDWHLLSTWLYLRKAGMLIGEPAGKDWVPAHDIALGIHRNNDLPTFELTREEALLYLKRADPGIEAPGKGWYVATYHGLGIGWFKSLGNRINNYLPKTWRVRMEIPGAGDDEV